MHHRWDRDFNRAARPPPDIIKNAEDTLVSWFFLLLFCIMLGAIIKILGINDLD